MCGTSAALCCDGERHISIQGGVTGLNTGEVKWTNSEVLATGWRTPSATDVKRSSCGLRSTLG